MQRACGVLALALALALVLGACRMTDVKQDKSPRDLFVPSATGYDAENNAWTCQIENTSECSMTEEQQKFAAACIAAAAGNKVTRCTCVLVLCSNRLKEK